MAVSGPRPAPEAPADGLVAALEGLSVELPDLSVMTVPGSVSGDLVGDELAFQLTLVAERVVGAPLTVGPDAEGMGLCLGAGAEASTAFGMDFTFTFGVDVLAGEFFLRRPG